MVERGALHVLALGSEDLAPIRVLMRKYADRPMDFADASLVRIAQRENIHRTYRLARGRVFTILPAET